MQVCVCVCECVCVCICVWDHHCSDSFFSDSFFSFVDSKRLARLFLIRRAVSLASASWSQHCWMILARPVSVCKLDIQCNKICLPNSYLTIILMQSIFQSRRNLPYSVGRFIVSLPLLVHLAIISTNMTTRRARAVGIYVHHRYRAS